MALTNTVTESLVRILERRDQCNVWLCILTILPLEEGRRTSLCACQFSGKCQDKEWWRRLPGPERLPLWVSQVWIWPLSRTPYKRTEEIRRYNTLHYTVALPGQPSPPRPGWRGGSSGWGSWRGMSARGQTRQDLPRRQPRNLSNIRPKCSLVPKDCFCLGFSRVVFATKN